MKAGGIRAGLILGCAALLMSEAALACRVNRPPAARVNRDFDAIVVAVVGSAGYTGEKGLDWHPWAGTTRFKRSIKGSPVPLTFEIGRTGSTAACDDGVDPPKAGEEWVIYLERRDGRLTVAQSYPLAMAIHFDARLRGYTR